MDEESLSAGVAAVAALGSAETESEADGAVSSSTFCSSFGAGTISTLCFAFGAGTPLTLFFAFGARTTSTLFFPFGAGTDSEAAGKEAPPEGNTAVQSAGAYR